MRKNELKLQFKKEREEECEIKLKQEMRGSVVEITNRKKNQRFRMVAVLSSL